MMKKSLSKTKPWFELHITNLLLEHHSLSCHPTNIHKTFIAPVEHEFSCSDTPFFNHKRKNNRKPHYHDHYEFMTVNKVKKVFDVLNSYEDVGLVEPEKSPLTVLGFGESRRVRQLRVTDSPFMENCMEDDQDGVQVDKLAEEFIKKFYKELKQEKRRAALEPPSPVFNQRWGLLR